MIRTLFCVFVFTSCSRGILADDSAKASVVKIHTTQRNPEFYTPWNKANPTESFGTGFVIDGQRIVTNAHIVQYATQVYVQPDQSDEKLEATVEAISYGLDLAVLKLENAEAISRIPPLAIENSIAPLRSEVTVYGFPIGGNQISITRGIISRIEYTMIWRNHYGLRTQIDAAVNPGNSGGPAISDGKVIGVTFSVVQNANNIGYLIHSMELISFLKDIEDGKCDGAGCIWDYFQPTENTALRARLKLPKSSGGVMINGLREPEGHPLQVNDVITKIGSHAIDSQGNVKVSDLTLSFIYFCPILEKDGMVPLTVWRDEKEIEVNCPAPKDIRLLLPYLSGGYPRYFIYGPLTFEAATGELAHALLADSKWGTVLGARKSPLLSELQSRPTESLQELVIVPTKPFSHRSTKGYRTSAFCVVSSINGIKIRSLKHLVEVLRDCTDEFVEIAFAELGVEKLVFNRKEAFSATESILTDNSIRKQYSDDLAETWNGGRPK